MNSRDACLVSSLIFPNDWRVSVFIRYRRFTKRFLLSLLFTISFLTASVLGQISLLPFPSAAIAQVQSADQSMQQGADRYRASDFAGAISNWNSALTAYQASRDVEKVAIALENMARAHQALGQTNEELQHWEQASSAYQQAGNRLRVGRMLTEQAQAYSRLGQYTKAIDLLCGNSEQQVCLPDSALKIAQSLSDRVGEVVALGSLGDAYRLRGKADQAVFYLEQGLAIARALQEPTYLISTLNSLGNAQASRAQLNYRRAASSRQIEEISEASRFEAVAKERDTEALRRLEESFSIAQTQSDHSGQLRALVSALPIYIRLGQSAEQRSVLQQAIALVETLPNSQEKVYASIDLAKFVQLTSGGSELLSGQPCGSQSANPQSQSLLEQAIASAQQIGDRRSTSFALGELGHLYECQSDYKQALTLTRQAQLTADQGLQARDSLYLWQWQIGRIFKAQGNPTEAIRAYEESLDTLESLRKDILTVSREIQFDFRETVEPIYRELVELRLQQEQPSVLTSVPARSEATSRDNISLALNTLDNLKLAEIQNYFGNDCVLTALNEVSLNFATATPKTAVFSTALLGDRVAVILNIPTQSPTGESLTLQKFEWVKDQNGSDVTSDTVVTTLNEYRRGLEVVRNAIRGYDSRLAEQIYDWVIRPFEPLLQQNEIQTLVFVQDGIFRSVPMAALYDGEAYLVENYAIAVTPSINLTNLQAVDRQQARALAVGLTQRATVNGTSFPALRYVESELQAVQAILPQSQELRDQTFTIERFRQALKDDTYPIIHIATHGKFSAEAENAFLVTGSSPTQPDQRLTLNVLDDLIRQVSLRNPLELLVLSACQTATGDDRAALGLAGIAAQAGARRVLASLWSVNDQATTELITQFYQGLFAQNLTNAQALQAAQKNLIASRETEHPAFWSAFILIGNWL